MTTTVELTPDLYQVKIPVPLPLKFVNCYLVRGAAGWGLVDAGLRYPAAEQAWEQAFAELDLAPSRITSILLTHYHPDHYGMAGWMQQRTGAPVWMTPTEIEAVNFVWGRHPDASSTMVRDFFRLYGMPDAIAADIFQQMVAIFAHTLPHPTITPMAMDAPFTLGDRTYELYQRRGHTDGHVCLYDAAAEVFIAGDHILPRITPNISLWPNANPDPLGDYMASLRELRDLPVALTLPAHGAPFAAYRERVDEIYEHHVERLELMTGLADGLTAFEISDRVFPTSELTPHQARFAMAETLSHLARLEREGRIRREIHADRIIFFRT